MQQRQSNLHAAMLSASLSIGPMPRSLLRFAHTFVLHTLFPCTHTQHMHLPGPFLLSFNFHRLSYSGEPAHVRKSSIRLSCVLPQYAQTVLIFAVFMPSAKALSLPLSYVAEMCRSPRFVVRVARLSRTNFTSRFVFEYKFT